jgi:hypothetical protein
LMLRRAGAVPTLVGPALPGCSRHVSHVRLSLTVVLLHILLACFCSATPLWHMMIGVSTVMYTTSYMARDCKSCQAFGPLPLAFLPRQPAPLGALRLTHPLCCAVCLSPRSSFAGRAIDWCSQEHQAQARGREGGAPRVLREARRGSGPPLDPTPLPRRLLCPAPGNGK